jgi:outer membrane lipoprotein-sorting protein
MKLTLILTLLLTFSISAQSADEIINKAEKLIKGESAHGIIEMTITTPDFTRTLKMESWWVGNEKALIVTKSPKKERGNKTLKIGNEMWTYLKNTESTIKIPPSMMLQSWNGSDFTNDDLVRESNLNEDYNLELLGNDNIDGTSSWKIRLNPKPDAPVVWGKLLYWVSKKNYTPVKIEYFDEKENLMRYMSFSDLKKFGDRILPSVWAMHNVKKEGHTTTMEIVEMEFDIKIKDRIFSFRELERGN